jgi:hypothetical protein
MPEKRSALNRLDARERSRCGETQQPPSEFHSPLLDFRDASRRHLPTESPSAEQGGHDQCGGLVLADVFLADGGLRENGLKAG